MRLYKSGHFVRKHPRTKHHLHKQPRIPEGMLKEYHQFEREEMEAKLNTKK